MYDYSGKVEQYAGYSARMLLSRSFSSEEGVEDDGWVRLNSRVRSLRSDAARVWRTGFT